MEFNIAWFGFAKLYQNTLDMLAKYHHYHQLCILFWF